MKKKMLALSVAAVTVMAVFAATTASSWVKVSDPDCNKCVMNDQKRKCGKCGGFMAQVDGTGEYVENGYLKYNYKCNKCSHTITYKNK